MMITIFIIACLSLLDFQPMSKSENPFSTFVVRDILDNSTTSGCTMNPSQGRGSHVDQIEIDWINQHAAGPQSVLPHHWNDTLPLGADIGERNNVERFIGGEANRDETARFPETPPVAVVSEPPTAAILTISGLALLYLIFGKKRQKSY